MRERAELLLDTSAAIALIVTSHERHDAVDDAVGTRRLGLAGHAMIETYSVLTRLPGAQRLSGAAAVRVIERNFPGSHALSGAAAIGAVANFAVHGIAGGAVNDGLVALAAVEADVPLLTCDRRALANYAALGVEVEAV